MLVDQIDPEGIGGKGRESPYRSPLRQRKAVEQGKKAEGCRVHEEEVVVERHLHVPGKGAGSLIGKVQAKIQQKDAKAGGKVPAEGIPLFGKSPHPAAPKVGGCQVQNKEPGEVVAEGVRVELHRGQTREGACEKQKKEQDALQLAPCQVIRRSV